MNSSLFQPTPYSLQSTANSTPYPIQTSYELFNSTSYYSLPSSEFTHSMYEANTNHSYTSSKGTSSVLSTAWQLPGSEAKTSKMDEAYTTTRIEQRVSMLTSFQMTSTIGITIPSTSSFLAATGTQSTSIYKIYKTVSNKHYDVSTTPSSFLNKNKTQNSLRRLPASGLASFDFFTTERRPFSVHLNITSSIITNAAIYKTTATEKLNSAIRKPTIMPTILKTRLLSMATATTIMRPQSNQGGKGASKNTNRIIGLSVGIPVTVVTLLIIATWVYLTKYKKISHIFPQEEEMQQLENGKNMQGLKYEMDPQ